MKHTLLTSRLAILFLFFSNISFVFSQWQTQGPYGGPQNALTTQGSNIFAGNSNGAFISTNNGQVWSEANTGIQRMLVSSMTANASGIFVGLQDSGIYFSSNNGVSWAARNNGLTNLNLITLFAADTNLFAGTVNGIFFSSDNGNSWILTNTGIPTTYSAYSFTQAGDTVFAGTYGMGLYSANSTGGSWSAVSGGFPNNSFVYALITTGNTIFAGTSAGVYKSVNNGFTWTQSNTGFPASTWANSFAVSPGYVFAGAYAEGIFVSTDNGGTWIQKNTGIPDLPFSTGLPHNYPTVQSLFTSGGNVVAATVDGMYLSSNNGNTWMQADSGILVTDITALAASSSTVYAGTARNGVFTSTNNGSGWSRFNNGLTSYDVLALTQIDSAVFVSVLNEKVFRHDIYNGATWVSASTGLSSNVSVLTSDSSRVLALTTGAQFTPREIFQTVNKGVNWTAIPSATLPSGLSALASTASQIYVGTDLGKIFLTTTNGGNWQDISGTLPSVRINSILITGNDLLVATDGQGIYKSSNGGGSWAAVNNGISNNTIKDLQLQNGVLYAGTWGGGVFVSNDSAVSWSVFNAGLDNFFVKNLTGLGAHVYAGTDAGVYSSLLAPASIHEKEQTIITVYPNPSTGIVNFIAPVNQKIKISVTDLSGALVYAYEGYFDGAEAIDLSNEAKGIYILSMQTEKEIMRRKIVIR